MPTAEMRSQVVLNNLLKGVAQLETNDLEQFVSQILTLRARRIAPSLSKHESEILEKINQGLPPDTQQRYKQELPVLIEHIERADAELSLGSILSSAATKISTGSIGYDLAKNMRQQ